MSRSRPLALLLLALLALTAAGVVLNTWDCSTDDLAGVTVSGATNSQQCIARCSVDDVGLNMWAEETRYVYMDDTVDLAAHRNSLTSVATTITQVSAQFRWLVLPQPCGCDCDGINTMDRAVWVRYSRDASSWTPSLSGTPLHAQGAMATNDFETTTVDLPSTVRSWGSIAVGLQQKGGYTGTPDAWFVKRIRIEADIGADGFASLEATCPTEHTSFYRTHYAQGHDQHVDADDKDVAATLNAAIGTDPAVGGPYGATTGEDAVYTVRLPAMPSHSNVDVRVSLIIWDDWDANEFSVRIGDGSETESRTWTTTISHSSSSSPHCVPNSAPCASPSPPGSNADSSPEGADWQRFTFHATVSTPLSTPLVLQSDGAKWALDSLSVCASDYTCDGECNFHGNCVAQDTCECDPGFDGSSCECPVTCVHGKCDAEAERCTCDAGWSGPACDVADSDALTILAVTLSSVAALGGAAAVAVVMNKRKTSAEDAGAGAKKQKQKKKNQAARKHGKVRVEDDASKPGTAGVPTVAGGFALRRGNGDGDGDGGSQRRRSGSGGSPRRKHSSGKGSVSKGSSGGSNGNADDKAKRRRSSGGEKEHRRRSSGGEKDSRRRSSGGEKEHRRRSSGGEKDSRRASTGAKDSRRASTGAKESRRASTSAKVSRRVSTGSQASRRRASSGASGIPKPTKAELDYTRDTIALSTASSNRASVASNDTSPIIYTEDLPDGVAELIPMSNFVRDPTYSVRTNHAPYLPTITDSTGLSAAVPPRDKSPTKKKP